MYVLADRAVEGLLHDRVLQIICFCWPLTALLTRHVCHAIVPTIAAVNGHVFAGGFFLMLACDYRVMEAGLPRAVMTEVCVLS